VDSVPHTEAAIGALRESRERSVLAERGCERSEVSRSVIERTEDALRVRRAPSGDVAERLGLCQRPADSSTNGSRLADALARDVERAPDLVEGARVLATEPVAKLEHEAFAPVGEVLGARAAPPGEDLGGRSYGDSGASRR